MNGEMGVKGEGTSCFLLSFILLYGSSWGMREEEIFFRRTIRHDKSDKADLSSYSAGKGENPENRLADLRNNELEFKGSSPADLDLTNLLEVGQGKQSLSPCIGNCGNNFPNENSTLMGNQERFRDWINSSAWEVKVPEKLRHKHDGTRIWRENDSRPDVKVSTATTTSSQNSNENKSKEVPDSSSEDNEFEWNKNNTESFSGRNELIERFLLSREKEMESWKAFGLFDESYLEKAVNQHWLKFPQESWWIHGLMGSFYTLLMLFGCGGNFLVIWMFIRCRSLRTPPNYLIVNLAVSDFLMMVKAPIFIINSWYGGPVLGEIGCLIYGFVGGLTGTTSILTLAAISLDRYYVIVHPLNPFKKTTKRRAFLMMIFVWMYAGTFSSIPLLGLNAYVSEGMLTSCSFDYLSEAWRDRAFVFAFFLAAYVLPIIAISFSYISIFFMVRAAERHVVFGRSEMDGSAPKDREIRESFKYRHSEKKHQNELKIAVLSAILILIWTLAWTPYAVIALMGIFGWKEKISPLASAIPALFCKTASCIDPFVYAINHPRFQRELQNKLGCPSFLRRLRRLIRCASGPKKEPALKRGSTRSASDYNSQTMEFEMGLSVRNKGNLELNKSNTPNQTPREMKGKEPFFFHEKKKNNTLGNELGSASFSTSTPTTSGSRGSYALAVNVSASTICTRRNQKLSAMLAELDGQDEEEKGSEISDKCVETEASKLHDCNSENVPGERKKLETLIL